MKPNENETCVLNKCAMLGTIIQKEILMFSKIVTMWL